MKINPIHHSICSHARTFYDPLGWPMADALEVCEDCGSSRAELDGWSEWQFVENREQLRQDLLRMIELGIDEDHLERLKKHEAEEKLKKKNDGVKILTVAVICIAGIIFCIWHHHAK